MARTITRRLDSVYTKFEGKFKSLYSKDNLKRLLKSMGDASESNRAAYLITLKSKMRELGIKYEDGKDYAYYENLVESSNLPSEDDLLPIVLLAIYDLYESYPLPEHYMKRIVDSQCKKSDGWNTDPLRLRILKQFVKYGNYLYDAGYGGRSYIIQYVCEKNQLAPKPTSEQVANSLDDKVFDCLVSAKTDQMKQDGKYGLLKATDDLAGGKFRTGGATKKLLYLFAMVFDMTFYFGEEETIPVYESDVEINLFSDYYTNNLMRFLTEDYKNNPTSYENDPAGQGINCKNFAEIVYLYYITKNMSAEDKIKNSTAMINRLKTQATRAANGRVHQPTRKGTKDFRNDIFEDGELFGLDEVDFEQSVADNYDCNANGEKHTIMGALQIDTEQNSAYREYTSILNELENRIDCRLEEICYGLWFLKKDDLKTPLRELLIQKKPNIDGKKLDKFLDLIVAFDSFLTGNDGLTNEKRKKNALKVSSAKDMTRSSLIVANYYLYLEEYDGDPEISFEGEFRRMKIAMDKRLDKAFYPRFNSKSIFDLLVAFSAYAFLNNVES